jgi:hypothetical protein
METTTKLIASALIFMLPPVVLAGNPPPEQVTVRITIRNVRTMECSGTIVMSDESRSLILTCAHPFRQNSPIWVDAYRAELIDIDYTGDVALLSITPHHKLNVAKVVPRWWHIKPRMLMVAAGFPERRDLEIFKTVVKRPVTNITPYNPAYTGIECTRRPEQGRSGGGLFTSDFYLVGVCNFASHPEDRGVYCVTESIYKILERNNVSVP